jgi:hypothetical protein
MAITSLKDLGRYKQADLENGHRACGCPVLLTVISSPLKSNHRDQARWSRLGPGGMRQVISDVLQAFCADAHQSFVHGGGVAQSLARLKFGQGLQQIVFTLLGQSRDLFAPRKISAVT